jgi:hypothetical protein
MMDESQQLALSSEMESMRQQIAMLWALLRKGSGGGGTIDVEGQILVKLASNATGGGWYNGNLWTPPTTTPTGSTTLAESQVGVIGDAILVCNLAEVTKATHDIKFSGTPTPYQFVFPGALVQPTNGGEDPFVAIYVAQWGCA